MQSAKSKKFDYILNFVMKRVGGMPDLHPGLSAPVGAALLSEGVSYPQLAGGNAGCSPIFPKRRSMNFRHSGRRGCGVTSARPGAATISSN